MDQQRIAELEQLLACEKTALDDEKAEHALTRAENQRLREALQEISEMEIDLYLAVSVAKKALLEGE